MSEFNKGDLLKYTGDRYSLPEWVGALVRYAGPDGDSGINATCTLEHDLDSWKQFLKGESVRLNKDCLVKFDEFDYLMQTLAKTVGALRDGGYKVSCKVVKVLEEETVL